MDWKVTAAMTVGTDGEDDELILLEDLQSAFGEALKSLFDAGRIGLATNLDIEVEEAE